MESRDQPRESVWVLKAEKREDSTLKEEGIRMCKRSEEMVLPPWIFRLLDLLDYENRFQRLTTVQKVVSKWSCLYSNI